MIQPGRRELEGVVVLAGAGEAVEAQGAVSDSPSAPPPMTLSAFGMNLHAATTADGRDRKQLERICCYLLRPPFAHDAVTALPGGRVRVSFKAPWRSGTVHAAGEGEVQRELRRWQRCGGLWDDVLAQAIVAGEHAVIASHVEAGRGDQGAEAGEELVGVHVVSPSRCQRVAKTAA